MDDTRIEIGGDVFRRVDGRWQVCMKGFESVTTWPTLPMRTGMVLDRVVQLQAETKAAERVMTAAYEVDASLEKAGFRSGEADELHNALALHAATIEAIR